MPNEDNRRVPAEATELKFTGRFGTHVHTCLDPAEAWTGNKEDLPEAKAITDGSAATVSTMAASQVQEHLALHEAAGTYPCPSYADPVSAIYQDPAGSSVWMSIDELTA